MKKLPFILVYSRLVIAIVAVLLLFSNLPKIPYILSALILIGLLTDIFDGIIARKYNVASEKLRIWDSNVDIVFWLVVIGCSLYLNVPVISKIWTWIIILISAEALTYIFSWIKFKRTVATHTLMAKFWTLSLLCFILEFNLNESLYSFFFCFWLGMLSRLEIILIILCLKNWTTDVPSLLSVKKINAGIPLRKRKLF